MNNIQVFNNPEFGDIRTVEIDGEPWFVGKDVATALGYSNTKDAIAAHVASEDKKLIQRSEITTLEIPNRGMAIINESGLYSLILGSKLDSARRFKHWVTSEVLPSIRKTGAYVQQEIKVPDVSPELIVRCAEIISASSTDKIPYVLEILKHIIPDIGNSVSAEVTKAPRLSQAGYTVPFNGGKLLDVLNARNMSIAEFARLVGIKSDRIYEYCDGRRKPGTEIRNKMCAALELPEGYFTKRTRRKR